MSGDGTPSDQPETVMDDAIAGLSARADATDQNITRMSATYHPSTEQYVL